MAEHHDVFYPPSPDRVFQRRPDTVRAAVRLVDLHRIPTRARRSLLVMPGSNARALEKAPTLPSDGIILDLEDSVAPDAKAMARDQIAQAIAQKGFGKREILIRVNALDSPWWIDDVTMAGKAGPDGILVPKISSVKDLNAIADRLGAINADTAINVWGMIETSRRARAAQ